MTPPSGELQLICNLHGSDRLCTVHTFSGYTHSNLVCYCFRHVLCWNTTTCRRFLFGLL